MEFGVPARIVRVKGYKPRLGGSLNNRVIRKSSLGLIVSKVGNSLWPYRGVKTVSCCVIYKCNKYPESFFTERPPPKTESDSFYLP